MYIIKLIFFNFVYIIYFATKVFKFGASLLHHSVTTLISFGSQPWQRREIVDKVCLLALSCVYMLRHFKLIVNLRSKLISCKFVLNLKQSLKCIFLHFWHPNQ